MQTQDYLYVLPAETFLSLMKDQPPNSHNLASLRNLKVLQVQNTCAVHILGNKVMATSDLGEVTIDT